MTKPRIGVFHPGTQDAWQRAVAFQDAGALAWYATSAYFHPDSRAVRLAAALPGEAGARLRRLLLKRYFPLLDNRHVRRMGILEFVELMLWRLRWDRLIRRVNVWGNRRFGQQVIALMQREPVDIVWGWDTSSLEVFRWAKARGITCVLNQSIGHPAAENATMLAEQERHPEFFARAYQPHSQAWIDRQDEEMDLADLVICNSDFNASTMIEHGCDPAKVRIVHEGYDETVFPADPPRRAPLEGRPAKLLFAGSVGARKGLAYLLPAISRIPPSVAELTLVGRMDIPAATFERFAGRVTHVPQVWHRDIVRYYREADLFVFPSLFEGSARVLHEAISAGTGLVHTWMAGLGATEGENGTVLNELSADRLTETLLTLSRDPERLLAWQAASWARRLDRTYANYRRDIQTLMGV